MTKKIYNRSSDYRSNFFKNNSGFLGTDKYQCVYCGRIKDKNKIQIDHFIPVHKVKKFGLGRILMKIKNINNINSTKNLVPACEKCNKKKGSKMGKWLIKGALGKHFWWWIIVWSFRLILVVAVLYLILLILDGYNVFPGFSKIGEVFKSIISFISEKIMLFAEKFK